MKFRFFDKIGEGMRTLLCILLIAAASQHSSAAEMNDKERAVRFVVLGDTQFGYRGVFERMTHEINMLQPDFVIQVGDLINGYTYDKEKLYDEWDQYKSQIEPLSMPFYPVPGNHDVVTPESEEVYGDVWGTDKYYYSFDAGPVHCIVLDTYWQEEDDRIAEWQVEWLINDLEAFAEKNGGIGSPELESKSIFLFMHAPVWRYSKDKQGRQDWDTIHSFLVDYPVKLVVGGHTHEYVWEDRDGIQYLVLNSSGGMSQRNERGGFFHCYLQATVKHDEEPVFGVIKAGSVLPIDTVNSEERSQLPAYSLRGGTLRIPNWESGKPLETVVEVPISNRTNEERTYELKWNVDLDANVDISPMLLKRKLGPKESDVIAFQISSDAAPTASKHPYLTMTSHDRLRSGYVSRDWEKVYKERLEEAENGADIYRTNIPLEDTFKYEADFRIFVPRSITVKRLEGDISIDGKLDDPAWSQANTATDFNDTNGNREKYQTEVKMLYDDEYLYIGTHMVEPNPEGMVANAEGDIPLTWNDDDIEFFFDPGDTQSQYSRLFQNMAGTRFNSMPRHIDDKYFDSAYTSEIQINEDNWVLEMQIPWSDIYNAKPPKSGEVWGLNIGRHRSQNDVKQSQWSGTGIYDVTRYGAMIFE